MLVYRSRLPIKFHLAYKDAGILFRAVMIPNVRRHRSGAELISFAFAIKAAGNDIFSSSSVGTYIT